MTNTLALAKQKTIDNAINAKDKLRLLLQQWSQKVKDRQPGEDQQQIWEKRTAVDSPRGSTMSKMSRMVGLKAGAAMPFVQSPADNYTMEELMRRIKRVEKLTDKMSHGQF